MIVKICGIQTIEDAQVAEENGADLIGFVFAPSKRRMTTLQAAQIANCLKGQAKTVGVFVNETVANMIDIAKTVQLDYIQLHGDEPKEVARALPFPVIKAFSLEEAKPQTIRDYPCDFVLIDSPGTTYEGGSGKTFDWSKLEGTELDRSTIILAGGLTPGNVTNAIMITKAAGVDVSSGVETKGVKDQMKIKQFMKAAKRKVDQQ